MTFTSPNSGQKGNQKFSQIAFGGTSFMIGTLSAHCGQKKEVRWYEVQSNVAYVSDFGFVFPLHISYQC